MELLDIIVVGAFLLGLLALGFFLSKRAGSATDEFILAGRKMPFWLAGTSVIATGLNASSMLQASRKVRQDGLSGMWFDWRGVVDSTIDMIWFLRLWRRAGFTTQMEFYHARYAGWSATFARLYDALVYGIILAAVWASVGIVGMKKIASVLFDLPEFYTVFGTEISSSILVVAALVAVTMVYSVASGIYGVVWTDLIEFIVTMVCSYILLFKVFPDVGWNTGLHERLAGMGEEGQRILSLAPKSIPILFWFLLIEPILIRGGYNPHVQRYLCVKDEREVLYTGLYGMAVNMLIKGWPFFVCGLAGIFLISDQQLLSNFPGITTPEGAVIPDYEKVMPLLVREYLPVGLVGLMVAGFMSAFMSSFDTNIHNSTCIFENDIYRPYIRKNASDKHYVRVSRIYMGFVAIFAAVIGLMVNDILYIMMAAFAIMGSAGLIKLLRFLWWRVNGRAEVAGQLSAFVVVPLFLSPYGHKMIVNAMELLGYSGNDSFYVFRQVIMMGIPTVVSLVAMFIFPPEPMDKLVSFYKRVRPYGWWGPVKKAAGMEHEKGESMLLLSVLTLSCICGLFGLMFVALSLFLAMWNILAIGLIAAVVGSSISVVCIRKLYPKQPLG